jgi:hypothetical protein
VVAGYLVDSHGSTRGLLVAPLAATAALLLAVAVFLADTPTDLRPAVRVAVGSGTPESGGMGRVKGRTGDGDER